MDSITHIVLGAAVGEVLLGRKIGKTAMAIGAFAQSLPDIDVVSGLWLPPAQYFLAHRGFTHSFLFAAIASALLSWATNKWKRLSIGFWQWFVFFFLQLLIHVLLDSLNAYGIGWFEPFSHQRISFDVLFVVDPFFSVGLGIVCVLLILLPMRTRSRLSLATIGIALGCVYIIYAAINKSFVNGITKKSFEQLQVAPIKTLTTPTPLNCWLWYVVAEANNGYFVGYQSVFDRTPSHTYHYFPKNDSLIEPLRIQRDARALLQLARDFYVISQRGDTLIFNNLRFGQINGWENPGADFIFRYRLEKGNNSLFTIQQGRFSGWNKKTWNAFVQKIEGN